MVGSRELKTNKQKDSKFSNSLSDRVKLDFGSENVDAETGNIYIYKVNMEQRQAQGDMKMKPLTE